MPAVQVTLIEGYDEQTRQTLAQRLTLAVLSTIAADPAGITVMLNEVSRAGYMRGGISAATLTNANNTRNDDAKSAERPAPGAAHPNAERLVRDYLQAMQDRDLDTAQQFLHKDFEMRFPGGARFTKLNELTTWAASRYRSIGKKIEGVEQVWLTNQTTVWCRGTLYGEWPDGKLFQDVAFVDRFSIVNGLLHKQEVWNDLAEVAANRAA